MRYWDASALVALCVAETNTSAVRRLARAGIVTWAVSAVEIASAIERRTREGSLTDAERAAARAALGELAAGGGALGIGQAALPRPPLDLQLGAALVAVSDRPVGHDFVCADVRLGNAAAREGFRLLPEA